MSNVTVQEALKAAIDCLDRNEEWDGQFQYDIQLCKAALAEIEKCEPVGELILDPAFLPALKAPLVNWKINLVDLEVGTKFYTSPQPIEKSEPVAEAIRERDRLGFAVVNVIGKLDEIIEDTQEVEIDDFLHIAVPVDMWNELQAALEEMPKRAELYPSPQPIDKCAPVYLIVSGADEIAVSKAKYDEWTSSKRISYTSPQPRECEDWQYFDKAYRKAAETSDATDWMNAALLAQQVRRKQLNTKG